MRLREQLQQNEKKPLQHKFTAQEEAAIYFESRARALAYRRKYQDSNVAIHERRIQEVLKQNLQEDIGPMFGLLKKYNEYKASGDFDAQNVFMRKYVDSKHQESVKRAETNAQKEIKIYDFTSKGSR